MTYAASLSDSPYALTTHAIVRLDPSPGRHPASPLPSYGKPELLVTAPHDEASLSHESLLIAHALTLSDVRTERVAHLQQAIATGTYHVSSADLAGKLLGALQS